MNTNIKKTLFAIAMILPMLSGADINAQGVVVYKTDGTRIEVPYNELDSIVTYGVATPGQEVADAVDLGLPSGTLWASWNVGATKPEEYGGYYAWAETEEKEEYNKKNSHIYKDIYGTEYDVAHVIWGNGWHMPTKAQIQELIDKCRWTWTAYNGTVYGYKVTGPNGNYIFLPFAGYRTFSALSSAGSSGWYWSGTYYGYYSGDYASYLLRFSDNGFLRQSVDFGYHYCGGSVRPVKEK